MYDERLKDFNKFPSLNLTAMRYESPLRGLIEQFLKDIKPNETYIYLSDQCLAWAVLAWKSRQCAPSECKEQLSIYGGMTVKQLNLAIGYTQFDKECIFASNLIAWVAYSSCSDEIDPRVHFKHSLAILDNLLGSYESNPLPKAIVIFGPFIIDCGNAWAIRNGAIPCKCTTFHQRVEYFDHLCVNDPAGIWYTGILEAANSTLGNLFEVSLTCVCEIITKEVEHDFTRDTVDNVLQYIRAELGDVDLHQALTTLNQSFQGSQTNHTSVDG
jgi:hypothetical protein